MDTKSNRSSDSIDSDEERLLLEVEETNKLYDDVYYILRQLTSKNFQLYLTKIRNLKIDSCVKLHGIIRVIFEEITNFESCALLCRELVLMPMPKSEELKKKFGISFITFRTLLYNRCEAELKKILSENQELININYNNVCYNKAKNFHQELDKNSVLFIKFLVELYIQSVITSDVLKRVLINALEAVDRKCFKCFCYLLFTIEEELRQMGAELFSYKIIVREIAEKIGKKGYFFSNDFVTSFLGEVKTTCEQTLESKVVKQTIDTQEPEQKQKFTLTTDPVTGRKVYKLLKLEKENKLQQKPNQLSGCQVLQPLVINLDKAVEKKKQELFKIVNKTITKLTSSSLKSTVKMITNLKVNVDEYVKYVIEIIMERATNNRSEPSALLCKALEQMQVPSLEGPGGRAKLKTFRELLLAKCVEELYNVPSLAEEENTKSQNKVNASLLKHVGLIQFMRELHKNQIVTDALVVKCIAHLLKNWRIKREENLQCVCRLLLVFGKELESRKIDLNPYFNTLKQICNDKQQKLSPLLRFMSKSLHDSRKANWSSEKQEICHILQNAYAPRMTKTEMFGITYSSLSKVSPTRYKRSLRRIRLLKFDTYEQIKIVVKILFKEAPACPEFCLQVCLELLTVKVPHIKNDTLEIVDIRRVLRNKCEEKMGKPDLTKFIGYLFEDDLITNDIVVKWVAKLLTNVNENNLLGAYEILVQVGEQIENNGVDLSPHYNRINRIVQKKHQNISDSLLLKLADLIKQRNDKKALLHQIAPQQIKVITKKGIEKVQTKDINIPLDHFTPMQEKALTENKKKRKNKKTPQNAPLKTGNEISVLYNLQNDVSLPSSSKIETTISNDAMKLDKVSNGTISFTKVHKELEAFFSINTPINEVMDWIQTNIGEAKEEEVFITALMTAILQQCIVNNKLNDQAFENFCEYIYRLYIGSSDSVEIYCLHAVQSFFYEMGFPEDLLFTTFKKLYDSSVILPESFLTWQACNDPTRQAGKRVALKQLTGFFGELKTNEYEDM